MIIPEYAKTAVGKLNSAGYDAYFVGGCVRDILRGVTPGDWDIATSALPEQTKNALSGYRLIDTGIKHGTVTAIIDGHPLEITTYRIDGRYTDSRHPDGVTFTSRLSDDLSRRDFTVNAMALSADGEVIDPFGGKNDIERGIITAVGDAEKRFDEDALRILRALRFASVCSFYIEEKTSRAIREKKELLKNISPERITSELTKLLCGANAGDVLREYPDIIGVVIPEITPCVGLTQHHYRHIYDVWGHTCAVIDRIPPRSELRWAALLHDLGKAAAKTTDDSGTDHFKGHAIMSADISSRVMHRLRFDNKMFGKVITLVQYHDLHIRPDKTLVRHWMSKLGTDAVEALSYVFQADILGQNPEYIAEAEMYGKVRDVMSDIIRNNECFSKKDLAVNGNDMKALALSGEAIGSALDYLLDAVIHEKAENEREKLIEYLKTREA